MRKIGLSIALLALACGPGRAQETAMRNYKVYAPTVERYLVHNQETGATKYNHCATVAWFKDRWVCLWNANLVAKESEPGQSIYMSTSRDGKTWTPQQLAFAPGGRSTNPVPFRQVQWQPSLIVIDDELWCFWSQLSLVGGKPDEYHGCWFSRLSDPDALWVNRRILFDGEPDAMVDGIRWRLFPSQNAAKLSSGRILVPIVMGSSIRRADDAPEDKKVWANEKRDSVIYSDDKGDTWRISRGTIRPGRSWAQFEPTVWEQPDGTVAMAARNHNPELDPAPGPDWSKALVFSTSEDRGETWKPLEIVPVETVVSRMHVLRADGRWDSPPQANQRYMMCHNDARHGEPFALRDRSNLALFFHHGTGFAFTAGINLTGRDTCAAYPHMWIEGNRMLAAYSTGNAIKVAHVSPLPDPDQLYLLPRSRPYPDSPRPESNDRGIHFHGHQWIDAASPIDLGTGVVSAGAWVWPEIQGALLDNRKDGRGFIWSLPGRQELFLPGIGPLREQQAWMRFWNWQYIGFSLDTKRGRLLYYRYQPWDGEMVSTQAFDTRLARPLTAGALRIGHPQQGSSLLGFTGDIQGLSFYPGQYFDAAEHRALSKLYTGGRGPTGVGEGTEGAFRPGVSLDPGNKKALSKDFVFPEASKGGVVEQGEVEGRKVLSFHGEASAGVELDANDRAAGDKAILTFDFRIERGGEMVICTTGDGADPVRAIARNGQLFLTSKAGEAACGPILSNRWNHIVLQTSAGKTDLVLNRETSASVPHATPATWVYLGQGFRTGSFPHDTLFLVEVDSVRSRIQIHDEKTPITTEK